MSKLEISKDFSSSKQKLYTAWTDQEALKQWWKPLGKQLVEVENNLEPGGTVRYRFSEDQLTIDGTYNKVEENELLDYSWNWHVSSEPVKDSAYTLLVRFEGDENQSSIMVTQDGFENEESIHPHQQGWEQGLKQLKSYLEGGDNMEGNKSTTDKNPEKEVAGYHEDPEQVKVGGA